jgi:beta-lactamase regulating signal transducer with metallopeptidase domain
VNTAFSWYLQNAITTALLVPFVFIACRAFRDRPAVQHALWLILLLKFLMPPLVAWPWQLDNLWQNAISFFATPQVALSVEPTLGFSEVPTTSFSAFLIPALISLWLIGAIALADIQLRKIRRQSRLIKHATAAPTTLATTATDIARHWGLAPIPVFIARGIASPFLWCLGRLKLIWPQNMLESELSPAIIAHELAHLRRRDHWIAWLEMVATLLWWWNPIFWLVRKNLRSTSEMACDALALAAFPEGRCEYAETLLELSAVSKSRAPALVLGVSAGTPSSFERRMSMIVSERVSGKLSLVGILAAGILALVSLPGWTYGQDRGDDTDAKKLAELKLKIAQEHLDLIKQKMAQDGADTKKSSQAEAERMIAVIHKLMMAAHQGDEDAARKLVAIHAKLQAIIHQTDDGKPGKTADFTKGPIDADVAKLHEAMQKAIAENNGHAAEEVAKALQDIAAQQTTKNSKALRYQAEVLEQLAHSAQQGDEEAAKKLARTKYELAKKMQDEAAKQNIDVKFNVEAAIKKLQAEKKLNEAEMLEHFARSAQQGHEEASKDLAHAKLELQKKLEMQKQIEADVAKSAAEEAAMFERMEKKRAKAPKQNTDAEREFEWKRTKQDEATKQNADAEIKAIEADIKKLQMMKRKLEQEAKKNSDPVKP